MRPQNKVSASLPDTVLVPAPAPLTDGGCSRLRWLSDWWAHKDSNLGPAD